MLNYRVSGTPENTLDKCIHNYTYLFQVVYGKNSETGGRKDGACKGSENGACKGGDGISGERRESGGAREGGKNGSGEGRGSV
jgi:hypothetical protein